MSNQEKNLKRELRAREAQRRVLGERYVGASLGGIRAEERVQVEISKWLQKENKHFLVYCGSPGIGKTYLCSALIPWALDEFPSFRYYNERELLKRVRESFDQSNGDYLTVLKYLIDDDLVMIDDLGSEKYTDWREDILFETIDQRYNSMLPTVFTSNFTREQIKKIYHPRFYDRLFACENTIIEFGKENASFRQVKMD